jgi:hypothetical protein
MVTEAKTTVEVRKDTKDRINAVKGPLTTDELINLALDNLPPDKVAAVFEQWQREAMKALKPQPNLKDRIQNFLRPSTPPAEKEKKPADKEKKGPA